MAWLWLLDSLMRGSTHRLGPAMDPRVDMTASGDTLLGHRRVEKIGLPQAVRYLRLNRRCHISGHFSG